MDDKLLSLRRYWGCVFARASRGAFRFAFHDWKRIGVEIAALVLSTLGLSSIGLQTVVHEHAPWEISLIASAIIIFVVVFIYHLITVPAQMAREERTNATNQATAAADREAELSREIDRLNSVALPEDKTAAERIASMKARIAMMPAWMRDLLREVVIHRLMNETDAIAWLAKAGHARNDHPLSNINSQTHWLIRDQYGTFTIVPALEGDLRKVFDL